MSQELQFWAMVARGARSQITLSCFLRRTFCPISSEKKLLKVLLLMARYSWRSGSSSSKTREYSSYCPSAFSNSLTGDGARKLLISTAILRPCFSAAKVSRLPGRCIQSVRLPQFWVNRWWLSSRLWWGQFLRCRGRNLWQACLRKRSKSRGWYREKFYRS